MSTITCPHCGSTATLPLPGLGDRLGAVFSAAFARRGNDLTFNNPELLQKFNTGECGAYCRKPFTRRTKPDEALTASLASRTTADRLRELEQLRVEDLINETEYQQKRAEVLKEL